MEDLLGGAAITIWEILKNWIDETRVDRSHTTFMEWYQWLVDRLIERKEYNNIPAYENHKDWKSPSF